jgi:phage tail protein X
LRIYRTTLNDRWDKISYEFYGDSDLYKEIIKQNPYLSIDIKGAFLLPEGVIIKIPDLVVEPVYPEGLPPWKA